MVDDYNMDERPERSERLVCYQVSLIIAGCNAVALRGMVVDRTFTSEGVDVRTRLLVDQCRVNVFISMLNFRS